MVFGELLGSGFSLEWLMGIIVTLVIVGTGLYIYSAFVWMTIAKKLKYDKPWLAWIPVANFFLFPLLAKKDWVWGFIFLVPIVNVVFFLIWTWKIYELRKYPGWLALVPLASIIPVLGWLAGAAGLVIMGLVAWKDL